MEVSSKELEMAVERNLGCRASFLRTVRVRETHEGSVVWDGVVHVFAVGAPTEDELAYAWTSPIEGSDRRRFYTVLGKSPINSAADAVRAAIAAEYKAAP